jgi:hypothetical protein
MTVSKDFQGSISNALRDLREVHPGRRGAVRLMAKGWKQAFDDPIDLPRGRQFVTLEDAGNYITKLPKAEHTVPTGAAQVGGARICDGIAPPKHRCLTKEGQQLLRPRSALAHDSSKRRQSPGDFICRQAILRRTSHSRPCIFGDRKWLQNADLLCWCICNFSFLCLSIFRFSVRTEHQFQKKPSQARCPHISAGGSLLLLVQ